MYCLSYEIQINVATYARVAVLHFRKYWG